MEYLAIGGVGLLRVVQANFNKQASRHLQSSEMYLYFGFFFEFMAVVCSFLYLCIGGFSGFGTETVICAAITGFCFVAELLTALFVMRHAPLVLSNLCALSGGLIVPLVNGNGNHNNNTCATEDFIPPVLDIRLSVQVAQKPQKLVLQPERKELAFELIGDRVYFNIDRLDMHSIVEVVI